MTIVVSRTVKGSWYVDLWWADELKEWSEPFSVESVLSYESTVRFTEQGCGCVSNQARACGRLEMLWQPRMFRELFMGVSSSNNSKCNFSRLLFTGLTHMFQCVLNNSSGSQHSVAAVNHVWCNNASITAEWNSFSKINELFKSNALMLLSCKYLFNSFFAKLMDYSFNQ